MPNLTVSSNVDTMLGAADNAAIRDAIGLGTTDTPTFANLTLTSPSLGSSAPVTISQTWDGTSSTFFSALKVDVTTSGSSTTSLLLDLRVGGVSYTTVNRLGNIASASFTGPASVAKNSPAFRFSTGTNPPGLNYTGAFFEFVNGNARVARFSAAGIITQPSGYLAFADSIELGTPDTILVRDSDSGNTLALRNGAAAQTFNVYGTYTASPLAYERLTISAPAGDAIIGTNKTGTGVLARGLVFQTDGATRMSLAAGGVVSIGAANTKINVSAGYGMNIQMDGSDRFAINSSGNIICSTNVGIGTTAPRTKLHLQDTTLPPLTEFSGVAIPDYTGVGFQIQIGNNTNARIGQASTTHGGLLALGFTANTNVVSALSFVGYLGSTSPTVAAVSFVSQKHNGTTGRTNLADTEISSQWLNGSNPLMTLLGGGNIGIGTTLPTSKLHVVGDAVLTGQLLGSNYTVGTADSVTQANIAITNNHVGFADSAIVITPKGTGGIIVGPKPDGTATGGNARGIQANDFQIGRVSSNQVASGTLSFIGGGYGNRASADYALILGGSLNVASANYASISGGQSCTASGLNSVVGGGQSNQSTAQFSTIAGGSSNIANASYSSTGGGQSNTASGSHTVVAGGEGNSSSGQLSVIAGGQNNTATGIISFISGGSYGRADRHGINAHAAGRFSSNGDAQKTTAVFRNKTTTNSAVELFLDGASARYTVTSGKIISMLINITGTKSDGSAVSHYVRQYSIKNIGGTTSEVYPAVLIGTDNTAGTSIAISANDTNDALKIEVTGVASETWRWVASVDAVEVGHGV